MSHIILSSMSEEELKDFLRKSLREILAEVDTKKSSGADILSVQEAAIFLRLKVSTMYEKTSCKSIPHFKKGNKLYFNRNELEVWLREGKVKTLEEIQNEASVYMNSRYNSKKRGQ